MNYDRFTRWLNYLFVFHRNWIRSRWSWRNLYRCLRKWMWWSFFRNFTVGRRIHYSKPWHRHHVLFDSRNKFMELRSRAIYLHKPNLLLRRLHKCLYVSKCFVDLRCHWKRRPFSHMSVLGYSTIRQLFNSILPQKCSFWKF